MASSSSETGAPPRAPPRSIQNQALLGELSGRAHLGEAAAITLMVETDNPPLIIDDSSGRRIATTLGLRCTGTVGLLVASKRWARGQDRAVAGSPSRPARFWISDGVLRRAIELAGE